MRPPTRFSVRRLTNLWKKSATGARLLRYPRVLGADLIGGVFVLIKWIILSLALSVVEGGRMLMQAVSQFGLVTDHARVVLGDVAVLVLLGAVLAMVVGGWRWCVHTLRVFSSFTDRWCPHAKSRNGVTPLLWYWPMVGTRPRCGVA